MPKTKLPENMRRLFPLVALILVALSASPFAVSEKSTGQISALKIERGLIEIDQITYSITENAIARGGEQQKISHLRVGQIVSFEERDNHIQSLTIRHDLTGIPQ
jgi:hypothetical protein